MLCDCINILPSTEESVNKIFEALETTNALLIGVLFLLVLMFFLIFFKASLDI